MLNFKKMKMSSMSVSIFTFFRDTKASYAIIKGLFLLFLAFLSGISN